MVPEDICARITASGLCFTVIKDIADHIRLKNGTDLYLFNADETFAEIKPYFQALINYFKGASEQEIQAFRRFGSSLTAVRQQVL